MGHQRAQVTGRGVRDPDQREALVLQQVEQVERVAAVGLRLPHDHRANLRGLAHEQRVAQARHEFVKPQGVPGALDADGHRTGQRAVKLLHGVAGVGQLAFVHLSRFGIEHRHLLLPCVQITADECHEGDLLSEGVATVPQPEPTNSGRPFS